MNILLIFQVFFAAIEQELKKQKSLLIGDTPQEVKMKAISLSMTYLPALASLKEFFQVDQALILMECLSIKDIKMPIILEHLSNEYEAHTLK